MTHKRTDKLDFIKIQSFCSSKDTVKGTKKQASLRKYLQIMYLVKHLFPECIMNP